MPSGPKFYTDEHVPNTLVQQLKKKGINIVSCQEVDNLGISDEEQLSYATQQGRTMITGDADFLELHKHWLEVGKNHAGIIPMESNNPDRIGVIMAFVEFLDVAIREGAATLQSDV